MPVGVPGQTRATMTSASLTLRKPFGSNPQYPLAYGSRGWAYVNKGEHKKAIADYNEVIHLDPKCAAAYSCRGRAYANIGDCDKAVADYNRALQIDPNCADAYNSLAWLQATCPVARYRDGKKALKNARKACDLRGGKFYSLDTLAAAYAENGEFEKAAQWQTKAIDMLAKNKNATEKHKQVLRSRLELYKQGKPYREAVKKK